MFNVVLNFVVSDIDPGAIIFRKSVQILGYDDDLASSRETNANLLITKSKLVGLEVTVDETKYLVRSLSHTQW